MERMSLGSKAGYAILLIALSYVASVITTALISTVIVSNFAYRIAEEGATSFHIRFAVPLSYTIPEIVFLLGLPILIAAFSHKWGWGIIGWAIIIGLIVSVFNIVPLVEALNAIQ